MITTLAIIVYLVLLQELNHVKCIHLTHFCQSGWLNCMMSYKNQCFITAVNLFIKKINLFISAGPQAQQYTVLLEVKHNVQCTVSQTHH